MTAKKQQTPLRAPRRSSSLADAIRLAIRSNNLEKSVAYPATVTGFDLETNLLEVEADFSDVLQLDEGVRVLDANILPNILLSVPGSSSGGYLTFPITVGDKGFVTVFDRSVDRWIERGEGGDPQFNHTHSRIDGVFIPNLRDKSRAIGFDYDQTAAVLESDIIKLGVNAVQAAARVGDSTLPDTTMAAWITAVSSFTGATPPTDFGVIINGSSKTLIE